MLTSMVSAETGWGDMEVLGEGMGMEGPPISI